MDQYVLQAGFFPPRFGFVSASVGAAVFGRPCDREPNIGRSRSNFARNFQYDGNMAGAYVGSPVPQGWGQLHDGNNGGVADQKPSPYFVSKSSGDWGNISRVQDRAFTGNGKGHVNVNLALNGHTLY